ncbi:MAG TPA: aminotransferase class V-fold PLP-dependent enzyme [Candidatus Krumholzibacteriaceae bacterium]|nr:aminotransferase class V-fold PLP-dependent enzyme [Candidatus Krumholzibacteriaceae bacterium]
MSIKEMEPFPLCEDKIYFNNAVIGAVPESTIKVVEAYWGDYAKTVRGEADWGEGLSKYRERKRNSKRLFAEILGAKETEVAFLPNASTGMNTAFGMIPFRRGQNVVLTDLSFPMCATVANKQREKGVEPRFIRHSGGVVETEQWMKAIDDDTAAVMVDQAGWFNGFLHDVEALAEAAHDHGAYLVVDGTQSAGAIRWDIRGKGVDFLATSCYKWLYGGPYNNSVGFFYMRDEIVDELQPDYVGGQTLPDEQEQRNVTDGFDVYDFKPKKGLSRIEIYSQAEGPYVAVENSMKLLLRFGLDKVERQIKRVDTKIIDGLLEMGVELQTPVEEERRIYLNAVIPDYKKVCDALAREGIHVSPRVGGLRISPGAYNTVEEAEGFLEALRRQV